MTRRENDSTAIFIWIDGFSFSALIGSRIFAKIPRISIESGKDFAEDFSFGMGFSLVKIIFESFFYGIPGYKMKSVNPNENRCIKMSFQNFSAIGLAKKETVRNT